MDFAFINKEARKPSGINIAIIGAGISGLSSAGYLSNAGHSVTVFERLSVAGGLMTYGIPEWRIPLENVQQGVD
ncbi:MAG: FAD-dependent oxidoreductase, partial [Desulfovibrionaceae bacterium]|nr:FAD-dependent oxidoreductase [Desulfovibrionaceae bacterium]